MSDLINEFNTNRNQHAQKAYEIVEELGDDDALNLADCILAELEARKKIVWKTYTKNDLSNAAGREIDEDDIEECQAYLDDFNPTEDL